MRRSVMAWGIIVASLVAAFITTITVLNSTTYSAHAMVGHYLQALQEGRTDDAARLAGVDPDEVIPVAMAADSAVTSVDIEPGIAHDGVVTVRAEVMVGSQPVAFVTTLRPAGTVAGVFTGWAFVDAPRAVVDITADGLAFARVNGTVTDITVPVLVLAPGAVVVESPSPWFDVPRSGSVFSPQSSGTLSVSAQPTTTFRDAVTDALSGYLDACATQSVMFPRSCPFGAETSYPISTNPAWTIRTYPEPTLDYSDGQWRATGSGVAGLTVTIVDIQTGRKIPVTESVPFTLTATIVNPDSAEPRIVVDYPAE